MRPNLSSATNRLLQAVTRDTMDSGSAGSTYAWIAQTLARDAPLRADAEQPLHLLVLGKSDGLARRAISALASATSFPVRSLNMGGLSVYEVLLQPGAKRPLHIYWIDAD